MKCLCSREKRVWNSCAPLWEQTTGVTVVPSHISSNFHSWEDQVLSFWVACGVRAFNELVVVAVLVTCVTANNGFPRSIIFLSLHIQRTLTFITSLPRALTHHWSWLCCDSFFTWFFLRSFWHHFRTICRTDMANVKQTQKMIPFLTCEISLGSHVCELVFGVNIFDLDFLVQIDSIEQPIKSNSVGSGNMSHCRASSLYNHLDHCFVVFEHIQQSFLMRKLDVWGNKVNIIQKCWTFLEIAGARDSYHGKQRVSPFYHGSESCFQGLKKIRSHKSRAGIPSNLNPASKEMISDSVELWNWGLSPQDLAQNRSLETVPAFIVLQYYPHKNTVYIHMCDECKISIDSGVCHRLWSIL